MTQMSMKKGLKVWGKAAKKAIHNEVKQMHLRSTFIPVHIRDLSATERLQILESHLFLSDKRDSDEKKGRLVAGGNKQRDFITKEDSSSPTVATESVSLTCTIDAMEHRVVAVVDIPNAFIQTHVPDPKDQTLVRLRGQVVDELMEIAPEVYGEFITKDKKNNPCLIVRCQNAIYGTMVASLLYYRKFRASLESIGFEFNPYDPCVANKMINGKQMTICFHVDDCKISHAESEAVDKMINWLKEHYETIWEDGSGKMKVSQGKIHKYLGMTLDYSVDGQVSITMVPYIDEILAAYAEADPTSTGTKSSAAPDNLYKIDEDCVKLSPSKAKTFHNLVAKTLFATKRARPDTGTAIAYLSTRVREPDTDDWKKLVHLMKYLKATRDLPLILRSDGSGILKWWVDGSFGVHPNMRGHTGGGVSMGTGFPVTISTKQKLNTRSSTESELVAVDDCMPAICWTRYFLEAQGYSVTENIVYQDNKSAILLEKNGKASSSKRTKHINIRFFFVTDRVAQKELNVEWCPTEEMIGDFFTKPLQGALFKKFRDLIMGVTSTSTHSKSYKEALLSSSKKNCWDTGSEAVPSKKPNTISKTKLMASTETTKSQQLSPQECVGGRTQVTRGGCTRARRTQVTRGGCTRATYGTSKLNTPLTKTNYGQVLQYPTKTSRKNAPKSAVVTLLSNSLLVN